MRVTLPVQCTLSPAGLPVMVVTTQSPATVVMRSRLGNTLPYILVTIKVLIITRALVRRFNKTVKHVDIVENVNFKEPFRIMNQDNVTVRLSPPSCSEGDRLLLLVSSGPDNVQSRARWREEMSAVSGEKVKVVFMVSTCQPGQVCRHDVAGEQREHGDILQTSLLDGHRRLGYKVLAGYVWAHQHCPGVGHVLKTDDNVVMDLARLVELGQQKESDPTKIVCGSGPPHRNMKTKRSDRPRMLGNWTADIELLPQDRVPDFCAGFLYLVTPTTGVRLAQAGLEVFGHFEKEITLIEDMLITGVLRQSLGDVHLDMLAETNKHCWLHFLSHCPWLTVAKLTFFDDLVINKTSDRSGVQYVGSVTSPKVWRFFLCLHLEVALLAMEDIFDVGFLWDICKR